VKLPTVETLFLATALLVPGFVWHSVQSMFIRPRASDGRPGWLRYLTLSAINYAIWSWLIYIAFVREADLSVEAGALVVAFVSLVSPVLLGALSGALSQRAALRGFLQSIGFNLIHPVPTSWDYIFGGTEPVILHVTLKSGTQFRGTFGEASFASSESGERDLYLEEIFAMEPDGGWTRDELSRGLWLSASEVSSIEFLAMVRD